MAVEKRDAHAEIATAIHQYILASFLLDREYLGDDTSLVASGIIDSTGIMEVVAFVEETFGIEVDDRDLTPDNFDSVSRLASYVTQRASLF